MPKLWTFSGINSWNEDQELLVDYVRAALDSSGISPRDGNAASFVSKLGTRGHYTGSKRLSLFDSERKLDKEADEFANDAVAEGELAGAHVCAMFIGPKTDTVPVAHFECALYWTPDGVPNQSGWEWPASKHWQEWAKRMPQGSPPPKTYAVSASHGLGTFLSGPLTVIEWRRVRRGPQGKGRPGQQYRWAKTSEVAPAVMDTVRDWMDEESNDIVVVAHSQGVNVALAVLNRGLAH